MTSTVEPHQDIVRLTVRHEDIPTATDLEALAAGRPAVLADLWSLPGTGEVLAQAPWEVHAVLREAQTTRHGA